ncbi:sarcosine oxidase subunit gamma [Rhodobacteraceae bacterium CY05]|uniref:Sarcosine oxidase subunit gamma n=1 Tax=Parasedimentitalea huanghaiensis TaxID=2682100 RepID=A0A6L6WEB6_9RHOB|nr:sarcosine oxidase subunit gamma [Zongyanglinia huanghaiensis]MVO16233.1 sarcosine oxidase subunit gamma [Zongyanglinia huanghaiensis]
MRSARWSIRYSLTRKEPVPVADLIALTPCDGILPVTIGSINLTEDVPAAMTLIAPCAGQEEAVSATMEAAHGMAFPAVNRSTGKAGARAIWFGQGAALLQGPAATQELADIAALTDQSDAWTVVRLEGESAAAVLARLAPVDLRSHLFKRGHTARCEVSHMMGSITRVGPEAFQIMVFRSMARTLVHDLKTAMAAVDARG